jgi:hypothetical protein
VPHGAGQVPLAAEVAALKRKVCGYKDLMSRRRAENRTIIADSQRHCAAEMSRAGANPFDECELAHASGYPAASLQLPGKPCLSGLLPPVWAVKLGFRYVEADSPIPNGDC